MLVKLVLVTCLGVATARPKMRDGQELVLHTGGAAELMRSPLNASCTTIAVTDSTTTPPDAVKDLLEKSALDQWQVMATFEVNLEKRNTTITDRLSKLIPLARQARQLSWCSMVVVVSLDPDFLIAFAEWSLKGRLLVWTTKLLVVSRLTNTQLQDLLPAHWTFSMMNTVFLNMEGDAEQPRCGMYTYLPYSKGGSQMVKIAFWTPAHGFKHLSSVSFFQDKFQNFYGAKVNVTSEPYMPYWDEEEVLAADGSKTIVYRGSDYRMVDAIASALNFTVRVLPTSSWTEVTRLVEEKTSLISPIIHNIIPERIEKFDFTYLYENSYSSFGMAKPNLEPRWKSVYYPLSTGVWIAVIGHVVFFPFLLWQLIRAGHDGDTDVSVGAVFQDMVGMLLGQNLPHRLSYTSSSRVLVAAWLMFALILGLAYRGNLTASLTLPKYPPRPETLKEIVDSVDMVTMPSYGKHFRKFYSDSESPLFQALGSLMNPGPSLMEGLKMALVKRSSHLDARKYIQHGILDKFTEKDGSTPLYVTRGSVSPTPCGWPIPHDAPYKAHLDRLIVATLEAGLYDKWTADLMRETKLRSQRRQRQRHAAGHEGQTEPRGVNEDGLPTLTINHTQGAFILLLLGLVFDILVFSSELLCKI
ncbi:ionotropic receptor 21a-like isoform X2 [Scylla paramamosain]|uniref:ionotropic receptor 21a-like isoform X2 n=1 Tax=Scylla paramamosain TaxID=85552 RepID=UPI003083DB1B